MANIFKGVPVYSFRLKNFKIKKVHFSPDYNLKLFLKGIKRRFFKRKRASRSILRNEIFDKPAVWIERFFNKNENSIVQVGSNDGITGDPLHELILKNKNWKVLFIEPVPFLFDKLKKNYPPHERFKFENVAINDGSSQTFYSVQNAAKKEISNLPSWFNQLGSFNRENITNHLNGILEPYIEEKKIQGVTLPYILDKNQIQKIDLIHIDVEGYDWIVLSQLDVKKFQPKIILYEHKHLTAHEKKESLEFLKKHAYSVFQLGADYIAVKKERGVKKRLRVLKGKKIL